MLSWRLRRQLFFFGIFAIIVFVIVGGLIWWGRPVPSCFDGVQNQGEKGVDCGGPCESCLKLLPAPSVLWTRFFKTGEGVYEVAALVENKHVSAGSDSAIYRLKLYNKENILIALRQGRIFINPDERFIILETDILTAERVPTRAVLEFIDLDWQRVEYKSPNIVVASKKISSTGGITRLEAVLRNDSLFPIENIEVAAVLLDEQDNVYAVSKTKIDAIFAESAATASFTWGKIFSKEPSRVEIYTRTHF